MNNREIYHMELEMNKGIAKQLYNETVQQTNTIYENTKVNIEDFIMTPMDLPTPGKLYLGNLSSLTGDLYKKYQINYIVSIYDLSPDMVKTDIIHEIYRLEDSPDSENVSKMDEILDSVGKNIHTVLTSGYNVLVHCFGGVSRSATVVIDYIMRYHIKCPREEPVGCVAMIDDCGCVSKAISYVKAKRKIVCPNPGFICCLLDRHLDRIYK